MAGYSITPLPRKLGIEAGMPLVVMNPPAHFRSILGKLPEGVRFSDRARMHSPFVQLFVTRREELEKRLPQLRLKLADNGVLWVSWPKKSAGVATDVTEDVIRDVALPLGLVDTKVCAIDETWSGLKLMIRRENRSSTTTK